MTTSTSPQPPISDAEKHRRATLYARLTYGAIILLFLGVCTVAVVATMVREKQKDGFQAIQLSKPISFFDYTYVQDDANVQDGANPSDKATAKTSKPNAH